MNVKAAKESLAPAPGTVPQLADYDKTYRTFDWKSVEAHFTWQRTRRVNIAHEAIDRHVLEGRGDQPALIHVGSGAPIVRTFDDLRRDSSRFAHALARLGIRPGDRVFVFMPRVPEAVVGMLGILKRGAIPAPLSETFMHGAVRDRMRDAAAVALLTHRALLPRVPEAELPDLRVVVVAGEDVRPAGRRRAFDVEMGAASDEAEPVWLARDDPLILHYTSGATGTPKGALQAQVAMVGHRQAGAWVLDLTPGDVVWCAADPASVTGTSCGLFAPWLNGAATVLAGGRIDVDACYRTIAAARVTVWVATPPLLRALMEAGEAGEALAARHDLSSLRHVVSAGEPLDPVIVRWGARVLGLRIHDGWLMTETSHHLIANLPSLEIRPGAMGKPLPGVEAAILDEHGHRVPPHTLGLLCIKAGWPGMVREVWNDPARYAEYFRFPGWYLSGDTATYDEDGYFWFQGRADHVIHTDGERVGPFEVESALAAHPAVAEAGVIGSPDPRHGQIVKAFVVLRAGVAADDTLRETLAALVKTELAAHAAPRAITFVGALPRDANGRIARRTLKDWDRPNRA